MKTVRFFLFIAIQLTAVAFLSSSVNAGTISAKPTPTPSAAIQSRQARASHKALLDLQSALKKIPVEKIDKPPHKSFIKKNDNKIVYSEPAGSYFVRSALFWNLSEKYKHLPIGDDIAWSAAQNPLPGECEGYLNCYVYVLTETEGRYLRSYPNGKKSKEAISLIERSLDMIVNDTSNYEGPTDATDRAELKKMLAELAAILAGSKHQEKTGALLKIKLIGELI